MMNLKKFSILLCVVFHFFPSLAQTVINGSVTDREKKDGIANINVILQELGQTAIIGFTSTDESGKFRIEYKGKMDSIVVSVSGFNIRKQSKTVANSSQTVSFTIDYQAIALNEVKIKAPKIRQIGDTLNYSVESFTDPNDRKIGDVLKKMPGIDVKEDGSIEYQNKPINKFYIENLDALQGRYGIATNNIDAKDVSTVQVMENHQPVKALKEIEFSDQAAINLKLKESAKGTLALNGQLGVGASPLLWDNELVATYLARRMQNISFYKGANTGNDITRELTSFYSSDAGQMERNGLLNVQSPANPSISRARYLFNRTNVLSTNQLWGLSNDYTLTANVQYVNDEQERNSQAYTEYYLPGDQVLNIGETLSSKLRRNQLKMDLQLSANKDKLYFNNLLELEGAWDKIYGEAIIPDTIDQRLKTPDKAISNTFNIIKTTKGRTWNIYSFNGYSDLDQNLVVTPVLYDDLFETASDRDDMQQTYGMQHFSSIEQLSLGWGKNAWRQNYTAGFCADVQQLSSGLSVGNQENVPDSLRNQLDRNQFAWNVSAQYSYAPGQKLRIDVRLPLDYLWIHANNNDDGRNDHRFYFNPSANVHYRLASYWNAMLGFRLNHSMGGIRDEYTHYILTSYRNLARNDGRLYEQQVQNYSLFLNYRNPLKTWFISMDANYTRNRANLLYAYEYQGILRMLKTIEMPCVSKNARVGMYISKELETLASVISVHANYSHARSLQANQGEVTPFRSHFWNLSPGITTKITKYANLSYQMTFNRATSRITNNDEKLSPISTMSHKPSINLFPVKGLNIYLGYEYFYNNAIMEGSRHMSFGDIGIRYNWKKAEVRLDYTNIFNTRRYVSASYSETSRYYYAYELRPAEVLVKVKFKIK